MTLLDELGTKVTHATHSAVRKGKELAEVTKIRILIADEERKINDIYVHIGKLYVKKLEDKCDDDVAKLIKDIRDTEEKIEEYKKQIRDLKGTIVCPHCNTELQQNSSYCNVCGKKL